MKCFAQAWTPWLWTPFTISYATSPVRNGSAPALRHRTQTLSASPQRPADDDRYTRKLDSPFPVPPRRWRSHKVPSLQHVARQVTVMTCLRLVDLHHRPECDMDAFTTELRPHRRAALAYQSAVEPAVLLVRMVGIHHGDECVRGGRIDLAGKDTSRSATRNRCIQDGENARRKHRVAVDKAHTNGAVCMSNVSVGYQQ